jgi:hypothetical protein
MAKAPLEPPPATLGPATPLLDAEPQAVSTEALRKAESYIEAERARRTGSPAGRVLSRPRSRSR